jgi:antitoxin MazE
MKATIVRIGNSRGIRIPKPLIEQCEIQDEVELEIKDRHLVIRPLRRARAGWDEAFRCMAECGDDILIDRVAEPSTAWDKREWHW